MAGAVCGVMPLVLSISMMVLMSRPMTFSVLAACFSSLVDCWARPSLCANCVVSGFVAAFCVALPVRSISDNTSLPVGRWLLAFMTSMTTSTGMVMSMAASIQDANWLLCAHW